jgi:hypothetical protein
MTGLFSVGDRVWYVISALGNIPPIWVAAVVQRIARSRVGIGVTGRDRRVRYVRPSRLRTDTPPVGVTTIGLWPLDTFPTTEAVMREATTPRIWADLQGAELSPAAADVHGPQENPPGGVYSDCMKRRGGTGPRPRARFREKHAKTSIKTGSKMG